MFKNKGKLTKTYKSLININGNYRGENEHKINQLKGTTRQHGNHLNAISRNLTPMTDVEYRTILENAVDNYIDHANRHRVNLNDINFIITPESKSNHTLDIKQILIDKTGIRAPSIKIHKKRRIDIFKEIAPLLNDFEFEGDAENIPINRIIQYIQQNINRDHEHPAVADALAYLRNTYAIEDTTDLIKDTIAKNVYDFVFGDIPHRRSLFVPISSALNIRFGNGNTDDTKAQNYFRAKRIQIPMTQDDVNILVIDDNIYQGSTLIELSRHISDIIQRNIYIQRIVNKLNNINMRHRQIKIHWFILLASSIGRSWHGAHYVNPGVPRYITRAETERNANIIKDLEETEIEVNAAREEYAEIDRQIKNLKSRQNELYRDFAHKTNYFIEHDTRKDIKNIFTNPKDRWEKTLAEIEEKYTEQLEKLLSDVYKKAMDLIKTSGRQDKTISDVAKDVLKRTLNLLRRQS